MFVAKNTFFFFLVKTFVATKIVLVAASANDTAMAE